MMMPHRALERFNRFTTQNIFSPTSVPKSSDSECASLVLSNPGTFRASLLSTALSYSWLSGGLNNSDMEEALLSRKLEAMRVVNAQIADPVLRTSDGCLSLIAALALVESGMGNYAAAEAHLKGLFTLIDIKTPENWQHRLYGLLQRAIAVTGSFIAAAKRLDGVEVLHQVSEYELNNYEQQIYSMRIPSSSAASPVPATNLSPFYFGIGSPIITACKLDIEGLILINALRQLSSMPAIDHTGSHRSRGSSLNPGSHRSRSGTPLSTAENPIGSYELTTDGTAVLLADTDAYTVSLLFKPHPMHSGARNSQQTSRSMSPATSHSPFRSATTCEPSGTPPPSASYPPFSSSPRQQANIPSADPPVPVPSASRAWAAAAYLYLHIVLASVWEETEPTSPRTSTPTPNTPSTLQNYHQQLALQQHQQHLRQSSPNQDPSTSSAPRHTAAGPRIIGGVPVDPHLLRALLDTLRADLQHTEEGMRSGSYNRDFWLWKTAVGAYCVEVLGRGGLGTTTKASPPERVGGGEGAERRTWWGWVLEEDDEEEGGSDEVEDAEGGMVVDDDDEVELVGEGEEAYMARLGAWFGERLRAWGRAAQVSNWDAARRALDRIVWPAGQFAGEVVAEGVWWRAVGDGGTGGGMGRPVMVGEVVIDPLLR
ncbi:hypothetical protein B0T18DRAFT_408061 [Schizothecium vesticola]|uniref:Transcription factor domain-containing protein n=1 Tax=Schizothecium vesticola TaxID=314040 RepID=A0AA40F2I7_9PEZI|nr:hypothetical protein B0T18DRAFT_408061 [Schizothecium vesticola]